MKAIPIILAAFFGIGGLGGLAEHQFAPALVSLVIVALNIYWYKRIVIKEKADLQMKLFLMQQKLQETEKVQTLLQSGELPVVQTSKVLLKANEVARAAIHAALLELQTTGVSAGKSGATLKLNSHLTVRTAATKGKAIKEDVTVSTGELVITDERIIFAGNNKSMSINLTSLIGYDIFSDGFSFSDDKKTYKFKTNNANKHDLFKLVLKSAIEKRHD